jgi:PAS domain S-box-containing protein
VPWTLGSLRFARARDESPSDVARAALEALPVAVVTVAAGSGDIWLNRRAREDDVIRADARETLAHLAARVLAGEQLAGECVDLNGGGLLRVDAAPVANGGSAPGAVLVVCHTTAREGFDAAMGEHTSASMLLIRDVDGQIVAANPAAERTFGYASGELEGRHVSAVYAPADTTPQERAREILGALQYDGHWGGAVHNVRKDGSTFWAHAEIVAFDGPGRGQLWLSTQVDVEPSDAGEDGAREAPGRLR